MRKVLPVVALFVLAALAEIVPLGAETIRVLYPEGVVRAFLVVKTTAGSVLADGDFLQEPRAGSVTTRTVFHFRDGSVQDETAVFTQRGRFRLVSDRLLQRGPSFPHPTEISIDAKTGRVTVKSREGAKEKFLDEKMALPADLANGIVSTLLKNLPRSQTSATVSMLVAAPKPRIVKLAVAREGESPISNGRDSYRAARFRIKVEIGGIAGVVAPIVGKQPRDASVWILGGDAPGFMRSESQFYDGAPLWRIELAAPEYPKPAP
ncbi:MAG: hypothetical protein ACRD16_15545 [Thermoanaerobaculia bacterium]